MAYVFSGIVTRISPAQAREFWQRPYVPLARDVLLLPFASKLVGEDLANSLPMTDGRPLSADAEHLMAVVSVAGRAAYIEAEFFGGTGDQAALFFEAGVAVASPGLNDRAINLALRWLAVEADVGKDEFDTVGLFQCRFTDEWLAHCA